MTRAARAKSFEKDLLSWIVVSHFLTADLVAELARALVKYGGEDAVAWEALFEEQIAGPPHLAVAATAARRHRPILVRVADHAAAGQAPSPPPASRAAPRSCAPADV